MTRQIKGHLFALTTLMLIGLGCSGSTPSNTGPVKDPEALKQEADKHRQMGQNERKNK